MLQLFNIDKAIKYSQKPLMNSKDLQSWGPHNIPAPKKCIAQSESRSNVLLFQIKTSKCLHRMEFLVLYEPDPQDASNL
jgi:hypothetical protein